MPRTLHAELAGRAEAEGVSLNQLIVGALSRAVGVQPTIVPPNPLEGEVALQAAASARASTSRVSLRAVLVANLIVVAIAGVAAIVLLLVAWHRGF